MGILIDYPSNIFSDLHEVPTIIASANPNVLWVTSLIVCNRGPSNIRFNLKRLRYTGSSYEFPCHVATTANLNAVYNNGTQGISSTLTATGVLAPLVIDGVTPLLNARVLVKNQTNPAQNGIYHLTTVGTNLIPWVLTRPFSYDSPRRIRLGNVIKITAGVVNTTTTWILNSVVRNVGTDPLVFTSLVPSSIFLINELEIPSYQTIDVITTTGVIQLDYSRAPYKQDDLVCFSNGYTQIFDCDVNCAKLNELL